MQSQQTSLAVPQSAGNGATSFDLSTYVNVTVQVGGVTASVLGLEATADGVNYVTIKTPLANGFYTLSDLIKPGVTVLGLRVATTSIGGGETPTVTVLAQDTRSR